MNIFSKEEIYEINKCQKWLKVVTIADIVTGCGRMSDKEYINMPMLRPRESTWKWPYQPKPLTKIWNIWRKAMLLICKDDSMMLKTPLGLWERASHQ